MWTHHTVLLLALCLGFYARGEKICEDSLFKACPSWFINRPSFPETEEDVLDMCPKILSQLECVQKFVDECGNENVHNAENLPKFKIFLDDICKEDSKIRADIVKELPCMKDALEKSNNTCFSIARIAMRNYLEENEPDSGDFPPQLKYCFYLTAQLSCMAAEFHVNCGTGARDILLDAHFRTGYFDTACKKDEMDELLELVSILELELAQKEQIGSVLHTYREFLSLDEVPEPENR